MAYRLVAQGDASKLSRLEEYEAEFPEGSSGYLELELRSKVAADIVSWLAEKLEAAGVPHSAVQVEGRFVRIHFRTEIAPLVLIAGAVAAVIFLVGLIVAWKLFKLAPEAVVGTATLWLIAGIVAVVIVALIGLKRGVRIGG